ncbi:MAG: ZIP family metal transporter [Baekduia sp.]
MIEAGLWGLVAGASLVVGAVLGLARPVPQRVIAIVMAFGAGVLISALSFELADEAFDRGGTDALALGLVGGALTFWAGDWIIDRRGGDHRKRSGGQQAGGSAPAIVLGAVLDGIPESVAIGVSLVGGSAVSAAVVGAVFLSNVPEALSAAVGLRKAGHSSRWILGLWAGVALISAVAAALGYAMLGGASGNVIGVFQAFAAGAILTMLADTMIPEAYEDGGPAVGVVTVLGFALAYLLSQAG